MRHKIRGGFTYRHFNQGDYGRVKKTGLYFGTLFLNSDDHVLITPSEVVKLRDFLSRYINFHIHKKDMELFVSSRMHARAIERNMKKAEAKLR